MAASEDTARGEGMGKAARVAKRTLPAPARAAIGGIGGVGATVAGLAGAWIAYSALAIDHEVRLPKAIDAERRHFGSPVAGGLSYYVAREAAGRPLVLIHSVNAAASAYEMGPLFAYYRRHRPVYALDLPGFGFSERSDRAYSPALYAAAIGDLLAGEVTEGGPADLVALSLGGEFAAFAARAMPESVRSLALISPTGIGYRGGPLTETERDEEERAIDRRLRAFAFPLWAQAFYDLLVTPPSLRYFLKQSFAGRPDEGLVAYAYRTSHQPGARHAPLHFVGGALFTRDVRATTYEAIEQPTLVLYDEDSFVSFDTLPDLLGRRPNWEAIRITPTRGLPHFEQPARTFAALDRFWSGLDASAAG
jgi:pimeloyl-ACP methyl ester carboxylesterase